MYVNHITDCRDENARMRLTIFTEDILDDVRGVNILGARNDGLAAFNLIDALNLSRRKQRVIFVNVAPRGGSNKDKWPNGSPFGWFQVGNNLVLATIEGFTLSLLEMSLGFMPDVYIFDIAKDVIHFPHIKDEEERQDVIDTQFRSLKFLVPAAKAVLEGKITPEGHDKFSLPPTMEPHVGWIDCFGNIKTTTFENEASWYEVGREMYVKVGAASRRVMCYEGLSHIPNGQIGIVPGSSGYGNKRFMEVMVGHGSAAAEFMVPDDQPSPSISITPIE